MNEQQRTGPRERSAGIEEAIAEAIKDDEGDIRGTEPVPSHTPVDVKEMPIREIGRSDQETWLRGYDANGLAELEEDPELIISEAEKLGVDSDELIECVLAESDKRRKEFEDSLDGMPLSELKRRFIDLENDEGPSSDYAHTFTVGRIDKYIKLIEGHARSLGKFDEWVQEAMEGRAKQAA